MKICNENEKDQKKGIPLIRMGDVVKVSSPFPTGPQRRYYLAVGIPGRSSIALANLETGLFLSTNKAVFPSHITPDQVQVVTDEVCLRVSRGYK